MFLYSFVTPFIVNVFAMHTIRSMIRITGRKSDICSLLENLEKIKNIINRLKFYLNDFYELRNCVLIVVCSSYLHYLKLFLKPY